jgi:hypothetical protein
MVSARQADTKDTLPTDTTDIFYSSVPEYHGRSGANPSSSMMSKNSMKRRIVITMISLTNSVLLKEGTFQVVSRPIPEI